MPVSISWPSVAPDFSFAFVLQQKWKDKFASTCITADTEHWTSEGPQMVEGDRKWALLIQFPFVFASFISFFSF